MADTKFAKMPDGTVIEFRVLGAADATGGDLFSGYERGKEEAFFDQLVERCVVRPDPTELRRQLAARSVDERRAWLNAFAQAVIDGTIEAAAGRSTHVFTLSDGTRVRFNPLTGEQAKEIVATPAERGGAARDARAIELAVTWPPGILQKVRSLPPEGMDFQRLAKTIQLASLECLLSQTVAKN